MTTPAPNADSLSTTPEAPASSPTADTPAFGWTTYAERINGRFAMVGFVALLVLELVTHQTFFSWLGF